MATVNYEGELSQGEQRTRKRQWIYFGPILAAPITHICVSLLRHAKTQRQKNMLIGFGIVGATAATIGMRLYLMKHAGYASSGVIHDDGRVLKVTEAEAERVRNPAIIEVLKHALKGAL
eukprot:comp11512_c0_seq1/m.5960 comp11512_c0_seq1/g.5960  ORF comp11512_c0_seq1/g.5960 comp11512_c0_seq1/m.5960 type:complete len:119 (-) comp11512_c0_seq1:324-680(-)